MNVIKTKKKFYTAIKRICLKPLKLWTLYALCAKGNSDLGTKNNSYTLLVTSILGNVTIFI